MRHFRAALPLLILAMLLAACGGATPAPAPAPGTPAATPAAGTQDVVTIGFAAQEFQRQAYEPLIAQFEQENPGIRVQFVPIDDILRSGAQSPDQLTRALVTMADTGVPFFVRAEDARAGLFYDLRPLVDADPSFAPEDFQPGALDAFSLDGGLYGIPRTVSVGLLSYNKDLFAARGVAEPPMEATWADLLALAEQLAEKQGDEVQTYGYVDWSQGFFPLLGLLGADSAGLLYAPADQIRLDEPQVEQALARVAALGEIGALNLPASDGASAPDMQPIIREGRVAMWPSDMLFIGPGDPAPPFARGTVPLPATRLPFFGVSESYVMSAGTQHPQEAWRWISFLSRQQIENPFQVVGGSQVPARVSVAEQSGYWSKLDEQTAAAVRAALARPAQMTSIPSFDSRTFEAVQRALALVAQGETPAEALRQAQDQLAQRLAEAPSQPSPTPDPGPVVVTLPEEAVAAEGATTIAFGAHGSDPGAFRALATEFARQNPDLFVDVQGPQNMSGPIDLASVASSADCFSWYGPIGSGEITSTLDLQPLIDADAGFALDDYPPQALAPFRHSGGLYGLPQVLNLRVLSYNPDLFSAAGVEPPTGAWSIADLVQAAQQLTAGDGADKQYGYAALGPQTEDLRFFLARAGAELAAGSGESVRPNFTDPKVFQAVAEYLDLLRNASPHTRIQGYRAQESFDGTVFELQRQGRLGMWIDQGMYRFMSFGPDQQQPKVAVAPPPGLDTITPSDVSIGQSLYISAGTEKAQACWRWLKFLSEDASQVQFGFPARASVAESDAFTASAPEGTAEVYRAYREALDRSDADLSGYGAGYVEEYWFWKAVDEAMQGADLEAGLDEAQRLTEEYLACVAAGASPGECARQVDPEYAGYMQP